MSDTWNNVTVLGPAAEIARFKRLSIDPSRSGYRAGQSGWDGCDCTIVIPPASNGATDLDEAPALVFYVHNFQQFVAESVNEYSFSFDTHGAFPEHVFEDLAARFPRLSFDCSCIEGMDEFMGFGWYNAPPGGEDFRQDYAVPRDYWKSGSGYRRSRTAQIAHDARVDALLKAARQYDHASAAV